MFTQIAPRSRDGDGPSSATHRLESSRESAARPSRPSRLGVGWTLRSRIGDDLGSIARMSPTAIAAELRPRTVNQVHLVRLRTEQCNNPGGRVQCAAQARTPRARSRAVAIIAALG